MRTGNVHYITGRPPMTSQGAARLQAAHAQYAAALRALGNLRCDRGHQCKSEYAAHRNEARCHVKEAFAEWLRLYERETGTRLKIAHE